jgi:Mg2+-importing ATPase
LASNLLPADVEEAARLDREALLARLVTTPAGLTRREAGARLARFGPNVVARERPLAPFARLLRTFFSPLPLLLLALAAVSVLSGEPGGALVIGVMVALSVLLSWTQEVRSGRAAERLRAMVHTTATVVRRDRGEPAEIPIARIVPGDIVRLAAGDLVPADVRLLESKDLHPRAAARRREAGLARRCLTCVKLGAEVQLNISA